MANVGESKAISRGQVETELLRTQINDQLNRLLTQLEDLDELRDEFDDDEYDETRRETMEQLRDFEAFMSQAVSGNMTLVDEFNRAQLAIQAAISEAFKTPEVIRMFANKQPDQLRNRLSVLQREAKLRHISKEQFKSQAAEVVLALQKLGSDLTPSEQEILDTVSGTRHLEAAAVDALGAGTQRNLISTATSEVQKATE